MADSNNSGVQSNKDEGNDGDNDLTSESSIQSQTQSKTQLKHHIKPPCLKYANRRRCVFKGDHMNDLPKSCSSSIGKKCEHGEHRDWNDGEYEQFMGLESVDVSVVESRIVELSIVERNVQNYYYNSDGDKVPSVGRNMLPDVVITSRNMARKYLWENDKRKLQFNLFIIFPIYGSKLIEAHDEIIRK